MQDKTSSRGSRRKILGQVLNLAVPVCLAVVVAVYIANILSYDIVLEARIDGEPVGYVQSCDSIGDAKRELESVISEDIGAYCQLGCRITYGLAYAKDPVYLTEEECAGLVKNAALAEYRVSNMLYVDGVMTAAADDADELQGLIADIESELLESAGEAYNRVEISNLLNIKEQYCPVEFILPIDEINLLINPLAKGQQTDVVSEHSLRISAFSALSFEDDCDAYGGLARNIISEDSDSSPALSYYLVSTETVDEIVLYETEYIDDPEHFVGIDSVVQEGSDGFRNVTYEIASNADGRELMRTELSETIIVPVVNEIVKVGSKPIPDAVPTGTFIWPCDTSEGISSGYGGRDLYGKYDFHLGIDLPGDNGDPIYASDGGEVVWAGFTPSYGNSVRILHNGELMTLYAHMRKLYVAVGDKVYQGQQIGEMGHTGAAYGTHLHFEVRTGQTTTNPIKYLPEMPKPEDKTVSTEK